MSNDESPSCYGTRALCWKLFSIVVYHQELLLSSFAPHINHFFIFFFVSTLSQTKHQYCLRQCFPSVKHRFNTEYNWKHKSTSAEIHKQSCGITSPKFLSLSHCSPQGGARKKTSARTHRCTHSVRPNTVPVTSTTPSRWATGQTASCQRKARWRAS